VVVARRRMRFGAALGRTQAVARVVAPVVVVVVLVVVVVVVAAVVVCYFGRPAVAAGRRCCRSARGKLGVGAFCALLISPNSCRCFLSPAQNDGRRPRPFGRPACRPAGRKRQLELDERPAGAWRCRRRCRKKPCVPARSAGPFRPASNKTIFQKLFTEAIKFVNRNCRRGAVEANRRAAQTARPPPPPTTTTTTSTSATICHRVNSRQ
jgi:hypothetical protein